MRAPPAALALLLAACTPASIGPLVPSTETELPVSCGAPALDAVRGGWDAIDAGDREKALRMFERASRNDPECVLALAHRGALTPNADGQRLLDEARRRARRLPAAERLEVELLAHVRAGDARSALDAQARLAKAYPQAWRAQFLYGRRLVSFERYGEAEAALLAAAQLAPEHPRPFELLGWTQLEGLRDPVAALPPMQRWAELTPGDAKAQQFLGTVLALNGRLPEAEAALRRSIALAPEPPAWDRLAWVLELQADLPAARIALSEWARVGSGEDRVRARAHLAWSLFAEGKVEAALSASAETEALAVQEGISIHESGARMGRGVMLTLAGRHDEALAALAEAETIRARAPLPEDDCGASLRWMWLRARVHAEARGGHPELAARTLQELRAVAPAASAARYHPQTVLFAEAEVLRASGDLAGADERLAVCEAGDTWCAASRIALAAERGDVPGAESLRAKLQKGVRQEPLYLYFRATNRPASR